MEVKVWAAFSVVWLEVEINLRMQSTAEVMILSVSMISFLENLGNLFL